MGASPGRCEGGFAWSVRGRLRLVGAKGARGARGAMGANGVTGALRAGGLILFAVLAFLMGRLTFDTSSGHAAEPEAAIAPLAPTTDSSLAPLAPTSDSALAPPAPTTDSALAPPAPATDSA